tara:strand:+ start:1124 stop:1228 length:105 start_codon:yes stop_codon:yes gene_type:complete
MLTKACALPLGHRSKTICDFKKAGRNVAIGNKYS